MAEKCKRCGDATSDRTNLYCDACTKHVRSEMWRIGVGGERMMDSDREREAEGNRIRREQEDFEARHGMDFYEKNELDRENARWFREQREK